MMYFHPRSSHTSPFKFLHLYGFLCVFVYVNLSIVSAEESSKHHPAHCSAPTLVETLALQLPLSVCPLARECPHLEQHAPEAVHPLTPRVAELNETTLEKALDLVHSSNGTYMAVLYYATWCPFSRNVRPIYDVLSAKFPAIHHVAVEESSVRPSVLSQYGVHSFPVLFMHSRTSRVRYYGPRTLEKLIYFYQNYTGLRAAEGHLARGEECAFARLVYNADNENKEVCPYPWAISPEKWLQDDTYLSLAIVFLGLRIIFIVVPILVSTVKKHWERRRNQAIPLRPNLPVPSSDRISSPGSSSHVVEGAEGSKGEPHIGSTSGSSISVAGWPRQLAPSSDRISSPGSSSRVVEGAEGSKGEPHIGSTSGSSISVAGWPRQLAPSSSMAIAESSSSRAGPSDEVYDIGRKQNVDNIFLHRSNRGL